MRLLWALGFFLLAACGGGPASSPTTTYTPPPAPIARPGAPVLTADWTPPLAATALCGGSPFACAGPADAKWGLLQPSDLAHFSPAPGALGYATAPFAGMALVSTTTLDRTKPMSLRLTVRADSLDCDSGVAYVGGVLYGGGVDDGDPTGRYRAEYISCFAGDKKARLWLYSPTYAGPIWDFDFRDGQEHELGLDWYPGDHVDNLLDGVVVFTEGKGFGHDPLDVPHDPHPALWFGSSTGAIGRFDVYAGP